MDDRRERAEEKRWRMRQTEMDKAAERERARQWDANARREKAEAKRREKYRKRINER
jgi:hypothetical protein